MHALHLYEMASPMLRCRSWVNFHTMVVVSFYVVSLSDSLVAILIGSLEEGSASVFFVTKKFGEL